MSYSRLYAIQVEGDGPVKIGQSDNPVKRMMALQGASPYRLRICFDIPNHCGLERAVHCFLSAHRLRGEWFANHPEVWATLARLETEGAKALDIASPPVEYAQIPEIVITRRLPIVTMGERNE